MTQNYLRSRRKNVLLILALGILNALTPFSIDMYLPSFPVIAHDLRVTVSEVALTVSIYFIGFALGQIFYGPLLDRFGRKRPLYAGLVVYVAATLGCMTAKSLEALLFFRFLSAAGGSAASVGATAMVRDYFPPEQAVKVFSMLMLVLSASPLLAPSVGSLVVAFSGWKMIFGILAGMGFLNLFLVAYMLPDALGSDHSVELRLKPILTNFRNVLKVDQFTTYTFAGAFSFTGLFVYVAGSPAIFLDGFQVSVRLYGAIFAFLAIGMIGGGQLNLLLLRRIEGVKIFRSAVFLQLVFGIAFFSSEWLGLNGLVATIGFLFLILLFCGIAYPNAAALALAPFTKNIGSAAALLGFIQLGVGACTSALVGLLQAKGSVSTALVISLSSLLSLIILYAASRKRAISASEIQL